MDALFVVVAQLLLIPLILWALIALELTLGIAASVVSFVLGRRSAKQALTHSLRTVRQRLLWSMIFLSAGLLLADLLFFDAIVGVVLAEVDERDDLDCQFGSASGSFILGRIELEHLTLHGVRGGADPSASFDVTIEALVIDIDTSALLRASLAVEEITVEGVGGTVDRLREVGRDHPDGGGFGLPREFALERLHAGDLALTLRDHTRAPLAGARDADSGTDSVLGSETGSGPSPGEPGPRELELTVAELDIGPLRSDSAIFDLLYRIRGRGTVAGVGFEMRADSSGEHPQTTIEVDALPLELIGDQITAATGLRVGGTAAIEMTNVYREDPPEPRVELGLALQLRELELGAADDSSPRAKLMADLAGRGIAALGREFPVEAELSITRSELEGVRSLAESGIVEAVGGAVVSSLRAR